MSQSHSMGDNGTQLCECGFPEKWAQDPNSPIRFDPRTKEYLLLHGTNRRWEAIMRYCFWCGGRLPQSTRGQLFTEPDEAEMGEVRSLLAEAKSRDDVFRILGKPDAVFEWSDEGGSAVYDAVKWTESFRYSTRWKTLDVTVFEHPKGSVSYAVAGKYIGGDTDEGLNMARIKKPWWKFWG